MPRLLLGVFMLLLASVSNLRAQGDVALFTVGAGTVGLKEFEYHFSKSAEKRPDVFIQTYGRFKQKVLWAKELGLDTLASYRHQTEYLRQALSRQEEMAKGKHRSSAVEKEWVKLVHVTCPLSQQVSKKKARESLAYLDSLYATLDGENQAPFESLPWIQTRHLPDEWKEQMLRLEKGAYSQPFYSPFGVHIIAWTDRRTVKSPGEEESGGYALLREKEMEEALLVASLDDYLEKAVVCSEAELETYFDAHKEEYGWGTPHYKGAVIHCQNKKEAKRIMKYLKKYPEALWQEAWTRMPAEVSSGCLLETGLFAIGENPFVDKLVFKCGEFAPKEKYPYVCVLGKKMKKGPASYMDVSEKLEKDYRKSWKEAEMEAFLQKYRVEIDEEVLKTVNRWGNK